MLFSWLAPVALGCCRCVLSAALMQCGWMVCSDVGVLRVGLSRWRCLQGWDESCGVMPAAFAKVDINRWVQHTVEMAYWCGGSLFKRAGCSEGASLITSQFAFAKELLRIFTFGLCCCAPWFSVGVHGLDRRDRG